MFPLFRSLLFLFEPETSHKLSVTALRLAGVVPPARWMVRSIFTPAVEKPVEVFGLHFRNPVGLAAGYDKDCEAVPGLTALGFGHLELGTITLRPQPGNPRPRVFRLLSDEAVINRMGFPGKGSEYALKRLPVITDRSTASRPVVIGVNLGKNKDTPLENASSDYTALMRLFAPRADYLAINISSPNTVGLRRLQGREMLSGLMRDIAAERKQMTAKCPVLVKIAPDLNGEELDDAVEAILEHGMDGIIVNNTTLSRERIQSSALAAEAGGLSGRPLGPLSETMLAKTIQRVNGRVPVVSAGGIMSADDAKRRLGMGAALVQIYTGMIYRGPGLVRQIVESL